MNELKAVLGSEMIKAKNDEKALRELNRFLVEARAKVEAMEYELKLRKGVAS